MSNSGIAFHRFVTFMLMLIVLIVLVNSLPRVVMYGIAGWQLGAWGKILYDWIMERTIDSSGEE